MSENMTEVLTGGAVLAVAAGFLFYAGQVGGVGVGQSGFETELCVSAISLPGSRLNGDPQSSVSIIQLLLKFVSGEDE